MAPEKPVAKVEEAVGRPELPIPVRFLTPSEDRSHAVVVDGVTFYENPHILARLLTYFTASVPSTLPERADWPCAKKQRTEPGPILRIGEFVPFLLWCDKSHPFELLADRTYTQLGRLARIALEDLPELFCVSRKLLGPTLQWECNQVWDSHIDECDSVEWAQRLLQAASRMPLTETHIKSVVNSALTVGLIPANFRTLDGLAPAIRAKLFELSFDHAARIIKGLTYAPEDDYSCLDADTCHQEEGICSYHYRLLRIRDSMANVDVDNLTDFVDNFPLLTI